MEKILNLFLYAGLTKERYDDLKPIVNEANRKILMAISGAASLLMVVLGTASIGKNSTFHENMQLYYLMAFIMGALFLVTIRGGKKTLPVFVHKLLIYIISALIYAYAIYVTVTHPEYPAVTAIAALFICPMLFSERPAGLFGSQVVYVIAFGILMNIYKTPELYSVDIWNMISFLMVSTIAIMVNMRTRFDSMDKQQMIEEQNREILFIGSHDLLTGLKNRNAFEIDTESCKVKSGEKLVAVYGDVNYLHEMNNRYGHEAGDIMLQKVGSEMQQLFGKEYTYRMGGDEFVSLVRSSDTDEVQKKINQLTEELNELDYYVSFGVASGDNDLHAILKSAEVNMYAVKAAFKEKTAAEGNERIRTKFFD